MNSRPGLNFDILASASLKLVHGQLLKSRSARPHTNSSSRVETIATFCMKLCLLINQGKAVVDPRIIFRKLSLSGPLRIASAGDGCYLFHRLRTKR